MRRVATTKEHEEELSLLEDSRYRERQNDLREVASTPGGRRFLMWLIEEEAGVMSGAFDTAPTGMAYREGQRAVGITVMQAIQEAAPERWVEAFNERCDAARLDKALREKAAEMAERNDT